MFPQLRADRGSRSLRATALATLTVATWISGACYSHTPVSFNSLAPQQHVRAVLAAGRNDEVSAALGRNGNIVEGELVEITDQSISLLVPASVRETGFRIETLHQKLLVARSDITHIERKQLDRTRTGLLVAGGGIALVAVIIEVFGGGFGGTDPPDGDGPAEARVPLLRLLKR